MERSALLNRLRGQILAEEWALLEDADTSLTISRWNRATLLRMRDWPDVRGEVPDGRVERLEALLRDYLNRWMAEQPQGHKWILLSCAFLAFIAVEPLHPEEIVHRRAIVRDGRQFWLCPAREDGPDSLCNFCVCGKMTARECET